MTVFQLHWLYIVKAGIVSYKLKNVCVWPKATKKNH